MNLWNRIRIWLILLLILLVIPIIGCSAIPDFKGEIRLLRIVLIHNDDVDIGSGLGMIGEASVLTEQEVGIKYVIVKLIMLGDDSEYGNLNPGDHPPALRQLRSLCLIHGLKDRDYDIVIGFNNDTFLLKHLSWAMQKRFGVIDDDYRRYIVLYHPTVRVIRHEVYHAFILSKGHTSKLMGSLSVLNPMGSMLNSEDKQQVLANKWRDFSKRVYLSPRYRKDRLSVLQE